jgi:hypothetical protein
VNFKLLVRPEVDADLLEAVSWYEQQQSGLGREFLHAAREKRAGFAAQSLPLLNSPAS